MLFIICFFGCCVFFFNTNGESLLIIPQCLCRLICMWLISVWRSCLWSAGRNPDSSVLNNLRDVLEIEFPSPATHEKSVCHIPPPPIFHFKHVYSHPVYLRSCVCVYLCMFAPLCLSVWAWSEKGVDVNYRLFSRIFPFFLIWFFLWGGHKFSFNWVVYRKDH